MCGRYFLPEPDEDYPKFRVILEELNRKFPQTDARPSGQEVFPSQTAPVIVAEGRDYAIRPMRWGFPQAKGSGLIINSRSETADALPMFRRAALGSRCLIPARGFYEWAHAEGGAKTKNKFAFTLSQVHGELMYFAGLYQALEGSLPCFVILTQAADSQMRPYHDRMPVMIREERLKKRWLAAPPLASFAELRRQFEAPQLSVAAAPLSLPPPNQ